MLEIGKWIGTKVFPKGRSKPFIDLTAGGIFACMFGPSWVKMHKAQARAIPFHCYSHRFGNYWHERYKEALRELTGFTSFVVYTSGSEAVESFLRVAWAFTGKSGVWGGLVDPDEVGGNKPLCDQFHGWTLGSRILAGRMTWHELGIYPELGEGRFGLMPEATACMGMEPFHAPSGQFHKVDPTINRIKAMKKEFPDILFLVDEIQGGFGRTGKLFAHEHYDGLRPDFVTIGKLAGGGFPLAVLCGPAEIMESDVVKDHAYLHSTHSGNPVTCSVGCMVIEQMLKDNLIPRSATLGAQMHDWLKDLPVPVHGKGLMAGLAFKDAEEAHKVVEMCQKKRLLVVDTGRKWVKIGPALNILDGDLQKGVEILKEVVIDVVSERKMDAPPCGGAGQEPETGGKYLPPVRMEAGVERIPESSENAGPEGSNGGTGTGPVAPASLRRVV